MKLAKKMLFLALISLIAAGTLAAGGRGQQGAVDAGPFPGRIAIVTNTVDQNEEEFRSAEQLVARYGAHKITHVTWPTNFMAEQEQMITILTRLAADMELRGLVINQSVPGTVPALDRFRSLRNDVFIVAASPQENPPDVARRADLVINNDQFIIGTAFVNQAHRMGARTIVHYSFPRHMSQVLLAGRRDRMIERANQLGIRFLDVTAPDPTGDAGITGTQQFILEDIPRQIAALGTDTAFFGTNCAMQTPMLRRVFEGRAMYPQPCCPSPFHAFPVALGIQTPPAGQGLADIRFIISETSRIAAENNMTGRLSNWPVPASMLFTHVGVEYIIRWINGEVPRSPIDRNLLARITQDYVMATAGSRVDLGWNPYVEGGRTFDNYLLIEMGYITY